MNLGGGRGSCGGGGGGGGGGRRIGAIDVECIPSVRGRVFEAERSSVWPSL